jgi:hypothetical protein
MKPGHRTVERAILAGAACGFLGLLPPAAPAWAQMPYSGQMIVNRSLEGQTIETADLRIAIETDLEEDDETYSVTLSSPLTCGTGTHRFYRDARRTPRFVQANMSRYCGASFVLITLRYGIPRNADIRQHYSVTHAFDGDTLEFVDTAPAAFENIAPMEDGARPGFGFILPQPIGVLCADAADQPAFIFYER